MPAILVYRFAIACPSGVIRPAGMTLPGKGWPVSGSLITVLISLKSPARIRVVGSVCSDGVEKRSICFHSTPAKKKSLSLSHRAAERAAEVVVLEVRAAGPCARC